MTVQVEERLEKCQLDLGQVMTPELLKKLGEVKVTVVPKTGQGHVYVKKTGRFSCHSPSDVSLQVGQCLADVPRLSGLGKAGQLKVYGMRKGESGVHILMTLQVGQSPFQSFEVAYNSDLLHGYCNDHPLVDFFSAAVGLH